MNDHPDVAAAAADPEINLAGGLFLQLAREALDSVDSARAADAVAPRGEDPSAAAAAKRTGTDRGPPGRAEAPRRASGSRPSGQARGGQITRPGQLKSAHVIGKGKEDKGKQIPAVLVADTFELDCDGRAQPAEDRGLRRLLCMELHGGNTTRGDELDAMRHWYKEECFPGNPPPQAAFVVSVTGSGSVRMTDTFAKQLEANSETPGIYELYVQTAAGTHLFAAYLGHTGDLNGRMDDYLGELREALLAFHQPHLEVRGHCPGLLP